MQLAVLPPTSHDPPSLSTCCPPSCLLAGTCGGEVLPLDHDPSPWPAPRRYTARAMVGPSCRCPQDTRRRVPPGGRRTRQRRETLWRAQQQRPPLTRDPLTRQTRQNPALTQTTQKCRC